MPCNQYLNSTVFTMELKTFNNLGKKVDCVHVSQQIAACSKSNCNIETASTNVFAATTILFTQDNYA